MQANDERHNATEHSHWRRHGSFHLRPETNRTATGDFLKGVVNRDKLVLQLTHEEKAKRQTETETEEPKTERQRRQRQRDKVRDREGADTQTARKRQG